MKNNVIFKINSSNISKKKYLLTKGKYELNMISTFKSLEYRFKIYINNENKRTFYTSWETTRPRGKVVSYDWFYPCIVYEYRIFDDCMDTFENTKEFIFKKLKRNACSKQKIRLSVEFRYNEENYISTSFNIIQQCEFYENKMMNTSFRDVTYVECEENTDLKYEDAFNFDTDLISGLIKERDDYIEKVNTSYEEEGFDYLKSLIAK